MEEELDIYLSDLTEGAQKTVLDFLGLKSAKEVRSSNEFLHIL